MPPALTALAGHQRARVVVVDEYAVPQLELDESPDTRTMVMAVGVLVEEFHDRFGAEKAA
jgi:hypothetical protein